MQHRTLVLAFLLASACSNPPAAQPDAAQPDASSDVSDAGVDAATEDAFVPIDAARTDLRVFATSSLHGGGFANAVRDGEGVAQAHEVGDSICQELADDAELGGTWVAWLSTDAEDAIDHVTGAGPWRDTTGEIVFADRAALATTPAIAITHDETGAAITGVVWTGTSTGGLSVPGDATNDTYDCYDFGYSGIDRFTGAIVGDATSTAMWTRSATRSCNQMARLYCFEQ
jgi:hypothetical protein